MPGRRVAIVIAFVLSAAAALAACDGDGGSGGTTPEPSPMETMPTTATIEPTGTQSPTPAPDIRQQELTEQPGLVSFLDASGGAVAASLITYVDLTGDGAEEAIVPVSSGGEGGDIAVFVFGYGPDGLAELLRVLPESGSLKDNIVGGQLTVTEPAYAPGDPLCCPSQLQTTTYRWDGSRFVVADRRTEQAVDN